MGKQGKGYGSEDHLLRYRRDNPEILDKAILDSIGGPGVTIEWVYPRQIQPKGIREPQGLSFLGANKGVLEKWSAFWPQRGMQQNWDGIARIQAAGQTFEWLLVEAKANHPEFCSGPSQASPRGLGYKTIERSLNQLKRHLGVHRQFPWLGTYYQFCNRLACLYFLQVKAELPTRLVELYFTGDSFPDKRRCPTSREEWEELIRARELTLGLPGNHSLADHVHHVFIPILPATKGGM